MSDRAPWLRGRNAATVPFGATLPRDGEPTARAPWLRSNGDEVVTTTCPGCAEHASVRADLTRLRAEAAAAGRAEGLAEAAMQRAVLSAATTAVNRARVTRDESVTELIVDVALGLCLEMAPAASAVDRRALVQLVNRALSEARSDTSGSDVALTLRMCAEDVAALGEQLPPGLAFEIGADLVPGEVWVEAPRLVVDGRWAPRLAALRESLLALVRAAEPAFELATDGPDDDTGDGEDDHGA